MKHIYLGNYCSDFCNSNTVVDNFAHVGGKIADKPLKSSVITLKEFPKTQGLFLNLSELVLKSKRNKLKKKNAI